MTGLGTRRPAASRIGLQRVGQEQAAAVAGEADAPPAAAERRRQRGAERVGEEDGGVDVLAAQAAGDRDFASRPRAVLVEQDHVVEPRRAVEHAGDVGLADREQPGAGKVLAHGADGRRGHHHVADPVRQEERDGRMPAQADPHLLDQLRRREPVAQARQVDAAAVALDELRRRPPRPCGSRPP